MNFGRRFFVTSSPSSGRYGYNVVHLTAGVFVGWRRLTESRRSSSSNASTRSAERSFRRIGGSFYADEHERRQRRWTRRRAASADPTVVGLVTYPTATRSSGGSTQTR